MLKKRVGVGVSTISNASVEGFIRRACQTLTKACDTNGVVCWGAYASYWGFMRHEAESRSERLWPQIHGGGVEV